MSPGPARGSSSSLAVRIVLLGVALSAWYHGVVLGRFLINPFETHPGQAVLVTGSSSGLGRHAALSLARAGYVVFGTVRKEKDAGELAAAWTQEAEGEEAKQQQHGAGTVVPVICDVTSDASVAAAAEKVGALLSSHSVVLAAVVNNAGVHKGGKTIAAATVEDYRWNFEVNVFALQRVTSAFLPLLATPGGRVVNVGSVAGFLANAKSMPYSGTKHAVEALSDAWRQELHPQGISVSLVQPGFIASKMCTKKDLCDEGELPAFSSVVLDAVASPFPRTRYPVAWVAVVPSWVACWIDALFPDRLTDFITRVVTENSGIE